ncbi:MAG: hypothetical protein QOE88_235, partial [Verrucomicrobiota bacterium]|nr:hypothetical protein [Verrucomicrobiota bacterium]
CCFAHVAAVASFPKTATLALLFHSAHLTKAEASPPDGISLTFTVERPKFKSR